MKIEIGVSDRQADRWMNGWTDGGKPAYRDARMHLKDPELKNSLPAAGFCLFFRIKTSLLFSYKKETRPIAISRVLREQRPTNQRTDKAAYKSRVHATKKQILEPLKIPMKEIAIKER